MNSELYISIKLNYKHEDLKHMNHKFNIYIVQKQKGLNRTTKLNLDLF